MRVDGIRTFEGPNVFHYEPVLAMSLRLEGLTDRESNEIDGFVQRLLQILPGLASHTCSRDRPGGLVERLHEGTYFGHVVEHVALELGSLLGGTATYGKTRYGGEPGLYQVIVRFDSEPGMRFLLQTAVELVDAIVEERVYPLAERLEVAADIIRENELGPSTRSLVEAAERRGVPWRRLDGDSLIEFGQGSNRKLVRAALSSLTSHIAVETACDKELTKSVLRSAFLPVPKGTVAETFDEAVAAFEYLSEPVVVKPAGGNQGRGVSLGVTSREGVAAAFGQAKKISDRVVIEEQYQGNDYRVLVVGGKTVAASLRVPCLVTGDGMSTIGALIETANQDPRRGEGHARPLTKIGIDETLLALLAREGWSLDDVPNAGVTIRLRDSANLSQGGTAVDVTDRIHPEIRNICERAARAVGLDICGVDLITGDIAEPCTGGIVELNASPGLRMHLHPSSGVARAVGDAILDMLYPPGTSARIPVCTVTGTNGKTTVTRMIGHVITASGRTVGMTTTDGIYVGETRVASGDMTGPASARAVLSDPAVGVAVLETARGGIVRRGLGYDWSDVAVITNIRADHIGQDGIEDLEDLVWIKSLVAERVREGGTLILNADDSETAALAKARRVTRVPRRLIYFSLEDDNPLVAEHLAQGGEAYLARDGWLVSLRGARERRLVELATVPVTLGGSAAFQISNCLAALAACRAMGYTDIQIAQGLATFASSRHNPGRANLFRVGDGRVLVDYGHNPDAFRATLETIADWTGPAIGIVGVPGDRDDSVIVESARVVAAGFDRILVREDKDLRGRRSGEVAELLSRNIRDAARGGDCKIVLDEIEALAEALPAVRLGATAVLFYERLEPVLSFLLAAGAQPVEGKAPTVPLPAPAEVTRQPVLGTPDRSPAAPPDGGRKPITPFLRSRQ